MKQPREKALLGLRAATAGCPACSHRQPRTALPSHPPADNALPFNFMLQTSQHQSGGCKLVELLFILSVNQECVARLKLRFSCMHKIKLGAIGSLVNMLC